MDTTQTPETKTTSLSSLKLAIGVFLGTLIISGIVIFAVLNTFLVDSQARTIEFTENTNGVRVIDPPRAVADFTMTAQTGADVSLSDLQGTYTLLYFGYTHCPDVCLISLAEVIQVREGLGGDAIDDEMSFVFISVDGERDTPERMQEFFRPRNVGDFMIGMTGDAPTLQRMGVDYGLFYQLNDDADQNGNYTVDHTANLYLIDPQGQLTTIFAYGTDVDLIIEHIQEKLG